MPVLPVHGPLFKEQEPKEECARTSAYMCMHVCVYARTCVCVFTCMCAHADCAYVYICIRTHVCTFPCACASVCIYMCVYIYMCVCVCVYGGGYKAVCGTVPALKVTLGGKVKYTSNCIVREQVCQELQRHKRTTTR